MVLQKKDLNQEYWPRLLKDKAKVHFLKTNFDKVSITVLAAIGGDLSALTTSTVGRRG
jgi:hypothetical protein